MSTAVAVLEGTGTGIIRADTPADVLVKATQIADALKGLIDSQGLAVSVGGKKKHVEVGAWQACGTMLGALGGQALHAETVWTRPVIGDDGMTPRRTRYTAEVEHFKWVGGQKQHASTTTYEVDGLDWEACVEVRTAGGAVVGKAEAMVSRSEGTWSRREDFALRSMAETRAESRAYRRAIGWIVHLAGYSPTPAEEMGHVPGAEPPPSVDRPFGAKLDSGNVTPVVAAISTLLGLGADGDAKARETARALAVMAGGYMPAIVGDALIVVAGAVHPAPAAAEQSHPEPEPESRAPDQASAQPSAFAVERALVALLNTDDESFALRRKADARMVALGATPLKRFTSLRENAGRLDELVERVDTAVTAALDRILALDDGLGALRKVVSTGMRLKHREPHEVLAALKGAQTETELERLVDEIKPSVPATDPTGATA